MPDTRTSAVLVLVLSTIAVVRGDLFSGAPWLQTLDSCIATLDGGKFPELIPDAVAWMNLEDGITNRSIHETELGPKLSPAAKTAIERVLGKRGGAPTAGADETLSRRDALVRELSPGDFRVLSSWVETRRSEIRHVFPISGELGPQDRQGFRRCTLEVIGREHPSLIPEAFYWEAYFRSKASAASDHWLAGDTLMPAFLRAQQKYHFMMPFADITTVFEVAVRAVTEIERVASTAVESSERRRRSAAIVREAREELIRRLPESSWRAVLGDATRGVRDVSVFSFPTGV
jgi:hypothetical protein